MAPTVMLCLRGGGGVSATARTHPSPNIVGGAGPSQLDVGPSRYIHAQSARREGERLRTSFARMNVSMSIYVPYFDIVLTTTAPTSFSRRFSRLSPIMTALLLPALPLLYFRRRSHGAAAASMNGPSSTAFCAAAAAAMIAAVSTFVHSRTRDPQIAPPAPFPWPGEGLHCAEACGAGCECELWSNCLMDDEPSSLMAQSTSTKLSS
ncbi:hypothetical protein DFH94DRAFT_706206 [Russula ochroleuca]|jgi:hypothetical protein|uniref:Uncharacterized protein n=1 Tax=Russula ochroleuca TaxID=152965 RepID=A0A9P5N6T6_9AGAM|nr:hypothetical protein DFH94DRAFT_706206 [Russula ochroleuca]